MQGERLRTRPGRVRFFKFYRVGPARDASPTVPTTEGKAARRGPRFPGSTAADAGRSRTAQQILKNVGTSPKLCAVFVLPGAVHREFLKRYNVKRNRRSRKVFYRRHENRGGAEEFFYRHSTHFIGLGILEGGPSRPRECRGRARRDVCRHGPGRCVSGTFRAYVWLCVPVSVLYFPAASPPPNPLPIPAGVGDGSHKRRARANKLHTRAHPREQTGYLNGIRAHEHIHWNTRAHSRNTRAHSREQTGQQTGQHVRQ
eukprot:gene8196-biopygen77